jgi:hypothetical protein
MLVMLNKFLKIHHLVFFIIIIIFTPFTSNGQEHEPEDALKHHRISTVLGHTHVPLGTPAVANGGNLVVASWGLNYEYWFSKKWGLGLHNDVEIASYVIEDDSGSTIERSRPVIVSLVGIYNPWEGLEFITGFGRELETHHSFWVYRVGVEYEIEFGHHWDLAPAFIVDIKENLYNSFTLAIVIGKRF